MAIIELFVYYIECTYVCLYVRVFVSMYLCACVYIFVLVCER